MNNADIAWMLVSTALVLLMTPALGFFYGGMVRSKNALNTLMMSMVSLGPVAVAWALLGYSLAFAPGVSMIGSLAYAGLRGVGLEAQGTIPHLLFMAFQGTFAIITAALISGAVVWSLVVGTAGWMMGQALESFADLRRYEWWIAGVLIVIALVIAGFRWRAWREVKP